MPPKKSITHTHSYLFRVLLDPLAPLALPEKMVLVVSVEMPALLAQVESRVWLDPLVQLEIRDLLERLVLL